MKALFPLTIVGLMLFSLTSMATEYTCKLGNSSFGNLFGKFKNSAVESCISKCKYDFGSRLKEKFINLQSLAKQLEKLYSPNSSLNFENRSAKEIKDKITSIKLEIQNHQNNCLQKDRDPLVSRKETIECLNKFKNIGNKINQIDEAWDKYKNARASFEIYRRYSEKGIGSKTICTIMLMGLMNISEFAKLMRQEKLF